MRNQSELEVKKKKQVKNSKWGNVTDQVAKFCVAKIF